MVQGKKIRLSRGTLNYIKSKKSGNIYKSTSSNELETILEGDEGESCTDDDSSSSCSISSSHSEPADINIMNSAPAVPVVSIGEHRNPVGISPRRLNQWPSNIIVQRYVPQGYKGDTGKKENNQLNMEQQSSHHCSYRTTQHVDSSVHTFSNQENMARGNEKHENLWSESKFESCGGCQSCRNKPNMDVIHPGQLWLPPVEWKVENMESLVWKDQLIHHKEQGGWWMERWTLFTENGQRLGDKFGVDTDGTPWSEWWIEKELSSAKEEGLSSDIKKVGQKWGRNAKGERWYETWKVKNNGKVETTYRLERANSGSC
jgi:hypothetical protein